MAVYLIGYDLNKTGKNYDGLIEKIKSISPGNWWHHLDSTWLINHPGNCVVIRDALKPFLDADDELLVVLLTRGEWATYGIKESGVTWLRNNL